MLLGLLVACDGGSDGIDADTTCALVLSLSGDLDVEITASTSVACASQLGSEGVDVEYILDGGDLKYVGLDIEAVTRGMTGEFPTTVSMRHDDGRVWTAEGCSAEIDEHTFLAKAELGDQHRIHGLITCPAPATGEPAGTLTLGPLEFVVAVTWFTG